jgi:hypothetical protein
MSYLIAILVIIIIVGYLSRSGQQQNYYQPVIIDDDDDEDTERFQGRYDPPPQQQYWGEVDYVRVPANLHLTYRDAGGDTTERTIAINGYDGSCYLRGFCNLRGEQRTFRIDRILYAVDIDTGEVVSDVPAHLRYKYENSPEYKIGMIFERYADIIIALLYAGKADGQLRREERAVICTAVRIMAKDKELPDDVINAELNRLSIPNLYVFRLAIGRIMRANPKNLRFIHHAVQKIIATQKTVHEHENEILRYVEEKMEDVERKKEKQP